MVYVHPRAVDKAALPVWNADSELRGAGVLFQPIARQNVSDYDVLCANNLTNSPKTEQRCSKHLRTAVKSKSWMDLENESRTDLKNENGPQERNWGVSTNDLLPST